MQLVIDTDSKYGIVLSSVLTTSVLKECAMPKQLMAVCCLAYVLSSTFLSSSTALCEIHQRIDHVVAALTPGIFSLHKQLVLQTVHIAIVCSLLNMSDIGSEQQVTKENDNSVDCISSSVLEAVLTLLGALHRTDISIHAVLEAISQGFSVDPSLLIHQNVTDGYCFVRSWKEAVCDNPSAAATACVLMAVSRESSATELTKNYLETVSNVVLCVFVYHYSYFECQLPNG
jgi:hypothetical protein